MSTFKRHNRSKKYAQTIPNEFDLHHEHEEDLQAFARALAEDPQEDSTEHISAMTDFMPIKQDITPSQNVPTGFEGFTYHIVRFPLMLIIFIMIAIEMIIYILVRQIVNLWEYFVQWRGEKFKLRERLRQSTTYEEWIKAAKRLDTYLNFDEWKHEIPDGYYNFNLLRKVNKDLRDFREGQNANPHKLKDTLQNCVKNNFGGVENVRLYSRTYYGTKKVVEQYIDEVTESLDTLRKNKSFSHDDRKMLFKLAYKNYGRTALCLSGGASFGYYHLGMVKALFDQKLLPSVITGTSAGGMIAALISTRTDEELEQVLTPELHTRLTACSDSTFEWLKRFWATGARFDACDWARKVQWITRGSLTFKEAYQRTGRILNISVIPFDPHSPSKLLNYITAPDCVIWSAVIASAAVPGILNPVVLMKKTKEGVLVPYNYGHRFKDGSLRTDIPVQPLHTLFNVKFTIVSQVNPHVHLFFYAPRGTIGRPVSHRHGRGWRGGFILSSLEQYLKLDLSKWLKVIRYLELLPKVADQDWSSIWLQRFDGNVTIWPKSTVSDWFYILTDPDRERLARMITTGQRVTWPKLHMISNRLKIERAIQKGREAVKREARRRKHDNSELEEGENSASTTAVSTPVMIGSGSDAGSSSGPEEIAEVDEMLKKVDDGILDHHSGKNGYENDAISLMTETSLSEISSQASMGSSDEDGSEEGK